MTPIEIDGLMSGEQAKAIWDEYERTHDLQPLRGQVGAVDLETGEVYIGPSRLAIDDQHRAANRYPRSVYLTSVGFGNYKDWRRLPRGRRLPPNDRPVSAVSQPADRTECPADEPVL